MTFSNSEPAESQPVVQIHLYRGKKVKRDVLDCVSSSSVILLTALPLSCLSITVQFLRCLRERDVSEFKA